MTGLSRWDPVFVFPGQGSQHPGMGRDLAGCDSTARALLPAAERATGLPVYELMTRADAATIADPEIAQLLVFVWSTVLHRQLDEEGVRPGAVAGHSLGEYSALVACGSLDWEAALSIVSARGRAMAEAARRQPGTMAALVGLDSETVSALCIRVCQGEAFAVIANHNSPRQTVVSGTADAIAGVIEAARTAGALRAKQLPVGGAYHSPLMTAAEDSLAPLLMAAPLRPPETPLVSSLTGQPVTDIEAYRGQLLRQVTKPVRWQAAVASLVEHGARTFVEVGPGRVLTGLGREMARDGRHLGAHEARRVLADQLVLDVRKTA
jgi:[acyl-carrier-protein] S-malonyltransferase